MALHSRPIQKRPAGVETKYRYNEQISAQSLRVITEEGEQLGVMDREKALEYAREQGLDLIEIASQANPPVAKVQSWSKFKFELLKKEKLAHKKNKGKELKEMWFQPLIGKNDLEHKIKRVKEFLDEKHNVRLVIKMRGRVSYDIGKDLMARILEQLAEVSVIDTAPKYEQRQILAIVRPGKNT